jgi:CHAT domain-containing protein
MLKAIQNAQSDDFAFYASDLYGKLIQPVQHIISGKKNLVIIPHNVLAGLPFEALLTAAVNDVTKKPPHKWPYLVKQYTVQYGLTANMWAAPPFTAGGTWAYAAWAPVFDTPETQAALANAIHQVLPHSTQLSAYGTPELPQLPESESEVQAAAQVWNKQPGSARLHLRRDATEASVRDMAGKSKIAHFATQGFSHTVHPRWSGLVLTPSGDDDGILYLSEIQLQTWTGTLCVLSGISNPNSPPDCALYPAYAFMRAGAGGVVSTLWAGQDQARIRLLTDFFSKKSGGLSISESLRQSKLALIKDKTTAEPHKWSGIIYFGK